MGLLAKARRPDDASKVAWTTGRVKSTPKERGSSPCAKPSGRWMSQWLAYMGSDPSLVRYALYQVQENVPELEPEESWGLGYEQESQMLVRKEPQRSRGPVALLPVALDLRTRGFVGHAGWRGGPRIPECTQPHRWRSWLGAVAGTLPDLGPGRAQMIQALPDFLRRNVRGQSDDEVFFHRFLQHLRQEAGSIQRPVLQTEPMVAALRSTVAEIRALAREHETPCNAALVVTNSRHTLVCSLGTPVGVRQMEGIPASCVPEGDPMALGSRLRKVLRPDFRSLVLLADVRGVEGWQTLEPGQIHAFTPRWEHHSTPLG